ncbi:hypothetical protein V8F20_010760 [Naviculisporaceae sp. PSN 640]
MSSPYIRPVSSTGRVPVDGWLVTWLYKYANYSPECHPLFRRYLLEVVLSAENVGQDTEKHIKNVDYCLRNWDIRDWYEPGDEFWSAIAPYDIYDFLNPHDGVRRVLPRPPHIPDEYNPASYGKKPLDDFEGFKSDGEEEKDTDYGIVRDKKTTATDPLDEEEFPKRRPKKKQGPIIGSREHHLKLLNEIPLDDIKGPEGNVRRIPPVRDQVGKDWETDSIYRGKRQPPLGIRLKTVVNFLCDDDCDRGIAWKYNFDDAVDYLHWLALEDKSKQIWHASYPVIGMFEDAVDKARTHVLFEKHHYDPTPAEIAKPPKVPVRTTRLDHLGDVTNWPLPIRASSASNTKLLTPRSIHPRPVTDAPEGQVNNLLSAIINGESLRTEFEKDEVFWWNQMSPGPNDNRNWSLVEAQEFDTFSRDDQVGWTTIDTQTQLPVLSDGRRLPASDPQGWARQRGAHRAGLQQILRISSSFTDGNLDTAAPRRKIILPNSASTIQKARQNADGPQYVPARLSSADYPGEMETMPYTIKFKKYLERIHAERTEAFTKLFIKRESNPSTIPLPKNIINGGPYIFRGFTLYDTSVEDFLEKCTTNLKLLESTADRNPRQLINYVIYYAKQAMEGAQGADTGSVPPDLYLAKDEVDTVSADGQDRTPRVVTHEDLAWLRFLTTECKNKTQILWSQEFGGDIYEKQKDTKYRLYHIFRTRVQRLLNDKNPGSLFSQADARVTVVDLLKEINEPSKANSTDVYHYTFDAEDTCCWLDRMQRSGLIKFRPSPINYGVVQRPAIRLFPEHRVIWPKPEENRPRPSYPRHIAPWKSIINSLPSGDEEEQIWNFFAVLGFRLGYTLYWAMKRQDWDRNTVSQKDFNHALDEFEDPKITSSEYDNKLATLVEEINSEDARKLFNPHDDSLRPPGRNRPASPRPRMTSAEKEVKALAWIREKIISEVSDNLTMLGPGREHVYFDPSTGEEETTLRFDFSWDCVTPSLPKGIRRNQYWTLDRWPLDIGYLSKQANEKVKTGVVHKKQIYDPVEADKTDKILWHIPQSRRITLDDNLVKFKPGPSAYVRGDTKYQRRKIERDITRAAEQALGIDTTQPRSWGAILGDLVAPLNPFSTRDPEDENASATDNDDVFSTSDGLSLPSVRREDVPQSWDLVAERWRQLGVVPVYDPIANIAEETAGREGRARGPALGQVQDAFEVISDGGSVRQEQASEIVSDGASTQQQQEQEEPSVLRRFVGSIIQWGAGDDEGEGGQGGPREGRPGNEGAAGGSSIASWGQGGYNWDEDSDVSSMDI